MEEIGIKSMNPDAISSMLQPVVAARLVTENSRATFMPRIIPRLLKAIEHAAYTPERPPEIPTSLLRKKRRSLWTPHIPKSNFSVDGRTKSVLLDDVNPLIHKGVFRRHKRLPPRVRVHKATLKRSDSSDVPRRMTPEEREWYANPYCE